MNLPTIDKVVVRALNFFINNPLPEVDLTEFSLPFVVGSGNALNTGKIIFSKDAAIFADESSFKSLAKAFKPAVEKGLITQAVVISASGRKDSVWEVDLANKIGLETTLLTCNSNSPASKKAQKVFSFKSIDEPYTYNTSTYLGMILSTTKEEPRKIKTLVEQVKAPKGFSRYEAYSFILPDEYINIAPMLKIKGDELFGPHLTLRANTFGHARHAKYVHPWEKELVITIGEKNNYFGHPQHRWDIPLPQGSSYATVMALGYYICGMIQSVKEPYFVKNITRWTQELGPKAYGKDEKFEVMVKGTN